MVAVPSRGATAQAMLERSSMTRSKAKVFTSGLMVAAMTVTGLMESNTATDITQTREVKSSRGAGRMARLSSGSDPVSLSQQNSSRRVASCP